MEKLRIMCVDDQREVLHTIRKDLEIFTDHCILIECEKNIMKVVADSYWTDSPSIRDYSVGVGSASFAVGRTGRGQDLPWREHGVRSPR